MVEAGTWVLEAGTWVLEAGAWVLEAEMAVAIAVLEALEDVVVETCCSDAERWQMVCDGGSGRRYQICV